MFSTNTRMEVTNLQVNLTPGANGSKLNQINYTLSEIDLNGANVPAGARLSVSMSIPVGDAYTEGGEIFDVKFTKVEA